MHGVSNGKIDLGKGNKPRKGVGSNHDGHDMPGKEPGNYSIG